MNLFTSRASTNALSCSCRSFNVPSCSNRSARLSDGRPELPSDGRRNASDVASYSSGKKDLNNDSKE